MGWLLFGLILVCTAVEVLIGVKRGIGFTGVRVLLLLIGTAFAALVAKAVTAKFVIWVARSQGLEGASVAEVSGKLLEKFGAGSMSASLGAPIAGMMLSIFVPMVFVGLFIIVKLLTLVLYILAKKAIEKTVIAKYFTERPNWSKISGGILGGLIGIFACAIIASPIFGVVNRIEDSGMSDAVFNMLNSFGGGAAMKSSKAGEILNGIAAAGISIDNAVERASKYIPDGTVMVYADGQAAADKVYTGSVAGIPVKTLANIYESLVDSPAVYLCRFTGAEAVAQSMYKSASRITPEDTGVEGKQTEYYSFPEMLGEVLTIAPQLETVAELINEGNVMSDEMIDAINGIVDFILETELIAEEDKLEIINDTAPIIQEKLDDAIGFELPIDILGGYTDYDTFKSDADNLLDMASVIVTVSGNADSSTDDAKGLGGINVEALVNDSEAMKDFVHAACSLSNGTDTVSELINSTVNEKTGGKISEVTSAEMLKEAGESVIIDAVADLAGFSGYTSSSVLTEEEKQNIIKALERMADEGVVYRDVVEKAEEWLK